MPVYSYRAINDDGKEVRGTLESVNEDAARAALKDLHLEVLEVSESTRMRQGTPVQEAGAPNTSPKTPATFAFEGTDSAGSVHRGTVQANTKFEAFNRLKDEQGLTLTMLAPMGTLPKYNDPDLVEWQKKPAQKTAPVPEQKPAKPKVSFANTGIEMKQVPAKKAPVPQAEEKHSGGYHSLFQTFSLYAGWLLAWYGLFVALGHYAMNRLLPWDIPFVQAFYVSPMIFSFTTAIFFYLLFSAINKAINGRWIGGILFLFVGIASFVGIRLLI